MADNHPEDAPERKRRLRQIDWLAVRDLVDSTPGEDIYVGITDQSMRSHIRRGRIAYIDPSKYDIWTTVAPGKNRAHLFMRLR